MPRHAQGVILLCAQCASTYVGKRRQHKLRNFCSVRCRVRAHRARLADGAAAVSYDPNAKPSGRIRT